MTIFPLLLRLAGLSAATPPAPGDLASADCAWYGFDVDAREWWYKRPNGGEYRIRAVRAADDHFDVEVVADDPGSPTVTMRERTQCDRGDWTSLGASLDGRTLKRSEPVCTRSPPRLVAGASWTCSFSWALENKQAATVGGHATWLTDVSDGGVVETPAGSWPTLLIVETPVDAPGPTSRSWLAKGVGVVKHNDYVLTAVSPEVGGDEPR